MKQMLPRFAPHRQSSRIVGAGVEPALYRFADFQVCVLDTLAHGDARKVTRARSVGYVGKVEIEDDFCLIHAAWDHEIRIHHAVVPVDHKVWIDPIVERAIAFSDGGGLYFCSLADKRALLQTKALPVFDHVVAVIEHAVEALM